MRGRNETIGAASMMTAANRATSSSAAGRSKLVSQSSRRMQNHRNAQSAKVTLLPPMVMSLLLLLALALFLLGLSQVALADSGQDTVLWMDSAPLENSTKSSGALMESEQAFDFDIFMAHVFGCIAFVGLTGNIIVILVIHKFTRSVTVTDFYIINLAFADLFFLIGEIPLIITLVESYWPFGYLACKFYMSLTSLNQFASSLLLMVMSFDRFMAVCHPIYAQHFRQLNRARLICSLVWAVCLALMSPMILFAKTFRKEGDKYDTCQIVWPDFNIGAISGDVIFVLYGFIIGFVIPLSLIAIFYLCVIHKLRLAASERHTLGLSSQRCTQTRGSTNRRIERLVVAIICTYSLCWSPYWAFQLRLCLLPIDEQLTTDDRVFFVFVTSLTYANSAINPILYAFLSENFKRRCSDIASSIISASSRTWFRLAVDKNKTLGVNSQPVTVTRATDITTTVNNTTTTTTTTATTNNHSAETINAQESLESQPLASTSGFSQAPASSSLKDAL